ncbi:MAG: type IV toxin-antitoxin system AbiEi family antitoxin domain-containing protein [Actinobacteria bacterium]|nr:type IV toxin-antitoxin system AbiEi family antitoxin domain-containing protein [Actinomycetota bacterium]
MHKRRDPDESLRRLARAQSGLVSAEQALILGLTNESLRRLVRQEHWQRLSHGVYDLLPGTDPVEKAIWAASLRAGEPCAIGGEAALRLYGLDRHVDRIVLWVPPDRRPRSGAGVAMRRDKIGRLDRRRGMLPRIRADDAVIDVAERLPTEAAVSLISEAVRLHLVTLKALRTAIGQRARVRNRKLLVALLDDLDGIESALEFVYRRDVERAHGLPAARRQRSVSSGSRSDVVYDEYGLLVELDGKAGHIGFDAAFRDLHRDNAHAQRRWTTLRYGSADVRAQACEVAAQVASVLRDHGWVGDFQPCPHCRGRWAVGF